MMNYKKIKSLKTIEPYDFLSSNQKENDKNAPTHETKSSDGSRENNNRSDFGPKLRKNLSVSTSSPSSYSRSSTKVSALKRAFSVGRSPSVTERYSRIHVQQDVDVDEEDDEKADDGTFKKERKSGKGVFRACKRIFGL